jgi:hypothetical protein
MPEPPRPSYNQPKVPCHAGCGLCALPGGGPGGGPGTVPWPADAAAWLAGYRGGGGGMFRMLLICPPGIWLPGMGGEMGGGGGRF